MFDKAIDLDPLDAASAEQLEHHDSKLTIPLKIFHRVVHIKSLASSASNFDVVVPDFSITASDSVTKECRSQWPCHLRPLNLFVDTRTVSEKESKKRPRTGTSANLSTASIEPTSSPPARITRTTNLLDRLLGRKNNGRPPETWETRSIDDGLVTEIGVLIKAAFVGRVTRMGAT